MKFKKFEIDFDGDTTLHFAAKSGNIRSITTYVTLGYDVNIKNNYGWTPLMTAVKYCQLKATRTLIFLGADLSQRDSYGYCILCLAASTGDLEIVKYVLKKKFKKGESLSAVQKPISPLAIAILCGHLEVIKFFISEKFKLDAPSDFEGLTPMYIASVIGNSDVLNLLKKFGYNLPFRSIQKNDAERVSHISKIFLSPKNTLTIPKIYVDSSLIDSPLPPSSPIDFLLSPAPKLRKLDNIFKKTDDFIFDQNTRIGRSKSANEPPLQVPNQIFDVNSFDDNDYDEIDDYDDVFYTSTEHNLPISIDWEKDNRQFIKLLRNNSLDSYMTTFKIHEIDMDAFSILSEKDLADIGIKETQRKRILKLGYQLRRQGMRPAQ